MKLSNMWYRKAQTNIPLDQDIGTSSPIIPPTNQSIWQGLLPPLHERCHCTLETLPNGNQIWRTYDNACAVCQQKRDDFNNNIRDNTLDYSTLYNLRMRKFKS